MLPVLDCKVNDGKSSEDDVVELVHDRIINSCTREVRVESEEPDRPNVQDVFVKHVAY